MLTSYVRKEVREEPKENDCLINMQISCNH